MRIYFTFFWLCFACFYVSANAQSPVTNFVNTALPQGGQTYSYAPTAEVPFGLAKPGPALTTLQGHTAKGYWVTQMPQKTCGYTGGLIRINPGTGKGLANSFTITNNQPQYRPGLLSLAQSNGISTKITADNFTAIYQFAFPNATQNWVEVNLANPDAQLIETATQTDTVLYLSGKVAVNNPCHSAGVQLFFHLTTTPVFDSLAFINKDAVRLYFANPTPMAEVAVTLSTQNINDAQKLQAKTKTTFDKTAKTAMALWEQYLQTVKIEAPEHQKKLFYNHLYQTLRTPVRTSNHQGAFSDYHGNVRVDKNITFYEGWFTKDAYQTKFTLFSLLYPQLADDIAASLFYNIRALTVPEEPKTYGWFTGHHAHIFSPVIDNYLKATQKINMQEAFMYSQIIQKFYDTTTIDNKIAFSYDNWVWGHIAMRARRSQSAYTFFKETLHWNKAVQTYLDKPTLAYKPQALGIAQGSLAQHMWFVPYYQDRLQKAFGGKEAMESHLNNFFNRSAFSFTISPTWHTPYYYNFLQKPHKTQHITTQLRQQFERMYTHDTSGYMPGSPALSAWYVWQCLGLYPVVAGSYFYEISTPAFSNIEVTPMGKPGFTIATQADDAGSIYIKSVKLNGRKYDYSTIKHHDLINGKELKYVLKLEPQTKWGQERHQIK